MKFSILCCLFLFLEVASNDEEHGAMSIDGLSLKPDNSVEAKLSKRTLLGLTDHIKTPSPGPSVASPAIPDNIIALLTFLIQNVPGDILNSVVSAFGGSPSDVPLGGILGLLSTLLSSQGNLLQILSGNTASSTAPKLDHPTIFSISGNPPGVISKVDSTPSTIASIIEMLNYCTNKASGTGGFLPGIKIPTATPGDFNNSGNPVEKLVDKGLIGFLTGVATTIPVMALLSGSGGFSGSQNCPAPEPPIIVPIATPPLSSWSEAPISTTGPNVAGLPIKLLQSLTSLLETQTTGSQLNIPALLSALLSSGITLNITGIGGTPTDTGSGGSGSSTNCEDAPGGSTLACFLNDLLGSVSDILGGDEGLGGTLNKLLRNLLGALGLTRMDDDSGEGGT